MTKPESLGLSSERLARIAPFLEERYIKPGKLPCAQVQVWRRGKLALDLTLGLADRERGKPLQSDSLFRIYSMTKPVTSVAFMMLVEAELALVDQNHRGHPGDRLGHRIDAVERSRVGDARAGEPIHPRGDHGRSAATDPERGDHARNLARVDIALDQPRDVGPGLRRLRPCRQRSRCSEGKRTAEPLPARQGRSQFEQFHRHRLHIAA